MVNTIMMSKQNIYKMTSKPSGIAAIMNNLNFDFSLKFR